MYTQILNLEIWYMFQNQELEIRGNSEDKEGTVLSENGIELRKEFLTKQKTHTLEEFSKNWWATETKAILDEIVEERLKYTRELEALISSSPRETAVNTLKYLLGQVRDDSYDRIMKLIEVGERL